LLLDRDRLRPAARSSLPGAVKEVEIVDLGRVVGNFRSRFTQSLTLGQAL
jgi:hypothetical protein